jgi:hypothetical protein
MIRSCVLRCRRFRIVCLNIQPFVDKFIVLLWNYFAGSNRIPGCSSILQDGLLDSVVILC